MLPAFEETEQLHCVKWLGVFFQDNLKMNSHVQYIIDRDVYRKGLGRTISHILKSGRGLTDWLFRYILLIDCC